jgi:hypothetical protein
MDDLAENPVRQILDSWLGLASPHQMPGIVTVASHMFGQAWSDLMLPAVVDAPGRLKFRSQGTRPHILVEAMQPAFLPGLWTGQTGVVDLALPDTIGDAP